MAWWLQVISQSFGPSLQQELQATTGWGGPVRSIECRWRLCGVRFAFHSVPAAAGGAGKPELIQFAFAERCLSLRRVNAIGLNQSAEQCAKADHFGR
jgi:hypothetical protein